MNELIAYCGLDCEKCEARIATMNNDDELRQNVAKEWSVMNENRLFSGIALLKKKKKRR